MLDASSLEVKVSWNSIHEPDEAPERVHLVLHDVQDRSKKVRHPLEEFKKIEHADESTDETFPCVWNLN